MKATGLLFMQRTKPLATLDAQGEFQLQLFAVDRIGVHQTEAWVLHWAGSEARAFWEAERNRLVPGTALQVETERLRSHVIRGCTPDIHARVVSLQIVKTPADQREASTA